MDNQQSKTNRQFWFIGFCDGEGSFMLLNQVACDKFRPVFKVTGTDFQTLLEIEDILKENGVPYHIEVRRPVKREHKESWMVVVAGFKRLQRFFKAFPPQHFRTKNLEALDLYAYLLSRSQVTQKTPLSESEQVIVNRLRNKTVRLAFNDYTPAAMV